MTVLQKIIEHFKSKGEELAYTGKGVAEVLKQQLPAEEQQIRDALNYGRDFPEPTKLDLETYIKNPKTIKKL